MFPVIVQLINVYFHLYLYILGKRKKKNENETNHNVFILSYIKNYVLKKWNTTLQNIRLYFYTLIRY